MSNFGVTGKIISNLRSYNVIVYTQKYFFLHERKLFSIFIKPKIVIKIDIWTYFTKQIVKYIHSCCYTDMLKNCTIKSYVKLFLFLYPISFFLRQNLLLKNIFLNIKGNFSFEIFLLRGSFIEDVSFKTHK